MPKKGGGILDFINIGLWGLAAKNSDGTFTGTILTRTWYGILLIGIILLPLLIIYIIWKIFGTKTPMPKNNQSMPQK